MSDPAGDRASGQADDRADVRAGEQAGGRVGDPAGDRADDAATGLSGRYFDAAVELLRRVRDEEAAGIEAAGTAVADAVAAGARIFAYGAGHSALPAQDVVYRAG